MVLNVVQSQEEVFMDVEPLALAVVDGLQACIMACEYSPPL